MSNTIGLDIGVGSVKVVSISKSSTGLVLDAIGEAKTPLVEWTKPDKSGKLWLRLLTLLKYCLVI